MNEREHKIAEAEALLLRAQVADIGKRMAELELRVHDLEDVGRVVDGILGRVLDHLKATTGKEFADGELD